MTRHRLMWHRSSPQQVRHRQHWIYWQNRLRQCGGRHSIVDDASRPVPVAATACPSGTAVLVGHRRATLISIQTCEVAGSPGNRTCERSMSCMSRARGRCCGGTIKSVLFVTSGLALVVATPAPCLLSCYLACHFRGRAGRAGTCEMRSLAGLFFSLASAPPLY